MVKFSSLRHYDEQHVQRILQQQTAVGRSFSVFASKVSPFLRKWTDRGGDKVWVRNSQIESAIDKAIVELQENLMRNIKDFQVDAWASSNVKSDELVRLYLEKLPISSLAKEGLFKHNLLALKAFQEEKDEKGLRVSEKVWNIAEQTKTNLEFFLESGISVGRSSDSISRDIRQMLNNPDKRFRRVRDEKGVLQLSNPMKDYHPGAGVYRSSKMNAMRLAATTTNRAYRKADCIRWNKLEFVVGIEIQRSPSNRGPCKICDSMVGVYPKNYDFLGFHPFCICIATPILLEPEDFAEYLIDGYIPEERYIKDIPSNALRFVHENKYMLKSYTVRENRAWFSKDVRNSTIDISRNVETLGVPIEKNLYVAIEPFSPVISSIVNKIRGGKKKQKAIKNILQNPSFELLADSYKGKIYRHPLHRGKGQNQGWLNTLDVAKDLNKAGRDIYFLPEYKDKISADALVQFNNKWVIADFKYITSTKSGTIYKELYKGFEQADTIVLKLSEADAGVLKDSIREIKRKGKALGNLILVNKNGKILEIKNKDFVTDKYEKIIKGFL